MLTFATVFAVAYGIGAMCFITIRYRQYVERSRKDFARRKRAMDKDHKKRMDKLLKVMDRHYTPEVICESLRDAGVYVIGNIG